MTMACLNPKLIRNPHYRYLSNTQISDECEERFGYRSNHPPDEFISVPCGNCVNCDKKRAKDFQFRLIHELNVYPNSLFITLTFDDINLTRFIVNPNKAVRLFLDRFRKFFGKGIRHWLNADYGELHGRLHYHGILFNFPLNRLYELENELPKLWKYGFVDMSLIRDNDCASKYVAKYTTKSINNGKRPPRVICSKGIGLSYLTPENIKFHVDTKNDIYRPFTIFNGYKFGLPRFYSSRLFTQQMKDYILLCRLCQPFVGYLNGMKYFDFFKFRLDSYSFYNETVRLGLSSDLFFPKIPKINFLKTFIDSFYYGTNS